MLIATTCMLGCRSNSDSDWAGVYSYVSPSTPLAGGAAISTKYTLELSTDNKCSLRIAGFQTDQRIVCALSIGGTSAAISFVSFQGGSQTNEFGVSEYSARTPLFELSQRNGVLSTSWNQLKPELSRGNPGVYFVSDGLPTSAATDEAAVCVKALQALPPTTATITFDVARELGYKAPRNESFEALHAAGIPCAPPDQLPDLDEQRRNAVKAVKAGRSVSGYWVAYTYPAERMKANLYGYMTALVRLDSDGAPLGSQVVSEQMAYEGYVREARSSMKDGLLRTCIREAQLFSYDENGDMAEELPAPRYSEDACGPVYPFGENDGRSSFPLVSIKQCQREGGAVDFCDEHHAALLSEALRTRAPDFNGHYVMTAMPEGNGRMSYAVVDVSNGTALPLPFDFVTKGKADYRISGSAICVTGEIHLDRKTRIAGSCYKMTAGSFERVESL